MGLRPVAKTCFSHARGHGKILAWADGDTGSGGNRFCQEMDVGRRTPQWWRSLSRAPKLCSLDLGDESNTAAIAVRILNCGILRRTWGGSIATRVRSRLEIIPAVNDSLWKMSDAGTIGPPPTSALAPERLPAVGSSTPPSRDDGEIFHYCQFCSTNSIT